MVSTPPRSMKAGPLELFQSVPTNTEKVTLDPTSSAATQCAAVSSTVGEITDAVHSEPELEPFCCAKTNTTDGSPLSVTPPISGEGVSSGREMVPPQAATTTRQRRA